jgi:hypothetical protein
LNVIKGSTETWVNKLLYVYVHTVKSKGRVYQYLVVEEYLGNGKRKTILRMRLEEAVKRLLGDNKENGIEGIKWCGGWDLNPRRPTPSGPKPDPFGQARAPPHKLLMKYLLSAYFKISFYKELLNLNLGHHRSSLSSG